LLLLLFMSVGWNFVSELRPLTGLLFALQMICESGEPRRNDINREQPKNLRNLSQCQFLHHKLTRTRKLVSAVRCRIPTPRTMVRSSLTFTPSHQIYSSLEVLWLKFFLHFLFSMFSAYRSHLVLLNLIDRFLSRWNITKNFLGLSVFKHIVLTRSQSRFLPQCVTSIFIPMYLKLLLNQLPHTSESRKVGWLQVSTSVAYPGDRLSWLRIFVVFVSVSHQYWYSTVTLKFSTPLPSASFPIHHLYSLYHSTLYCTVSLLFCIQGLPGSNLGPET
jgi:hypothetical protein